MKRYTEWLIENWILLNAILSIVAVGLIFFFLTKEGLNLFKTYPIQEFLLGERWYPISEPPKFGILPLILGSFWVTAGAALIVIPLGLASALFIAEVSRGWLKEFLKAGVEVLASIPSIVLGFVGLVTLVPMIKQIFHIPTGLTALSGAIMLAFMAVPTVVSIIEDALTAVPRTYRDGSIAMGATRWQTIYRIVVPAAASGIAAGVMLGIGRVIGETMAVMMITGNAAVIPHTLLQPVRTMTATIAAEMGEAVQGSEHYFSLFAIGMVLFLITFMINLAADFFLHKKR